ncbi:preprotein translocase subunit SecG [Lactobacillus colini]|uniref:Preprotein translocase subunit SecG n=1 Tax=Lactobacillus colini TaxID=1819254 RepID=A0ABS4MBD3_9LACO|nr:preprotein translocase subunit SecG [Lactobacillus colini]
MLTKVTIVCAIIFVLLCIITVFSTWKTNKLKSKVEQKRNYRKMNVL